MLKRVKIDKLMKCPIFDINSVVDGEIVPKEIIKTERKEQNEEKIQGKHFKQMTKEERLYLLKVKDKILKSKGITFAQHALDRMEERYIKERDIIKAIRSGQIVEYRENEENNDKLVTIRSCILTRNDRNVYVIMSILTGKIITTYSDKSWVMYEKQWNLDKYEEGFMIDIPPYYQKEINFFYSH